MTHYFTAKLDIIGVNPFVWVPAPVLEQIFTAAGKNKGPIPVCGTVNGEKYFQTLVRFDGHWRLYINTKMLKKSPEKIGKILEISIAFDPEERTIVPPPEWIAALEAHPEAREVFNRLTPSRQKEIVRYIASLKSAESTARNINRAIGFLTGKNRFIGRDRPD